MPSFPDNLLDRGHFPLLKYRSLNAPAPGDLWGDHEIAPRAKVSIAFNYLCNSMDLDPTWLPGLNGLEIINNKRHLCIACNYIFILARGLKLATSNVETLTVELEANSIN